MRNPFRYFNSSPEVIRLTVMMYVRYSLSLRQVEDLLFLRRAMKRYGQPRVIVTDRLRSYRAAMNVIGNAADQECGRRLNNRAENSHQPFRRREGAMSKFRDVKTLQKFASIHASIHNHFNLERHLTPRETFKQNRAAAMAEWLQLAA
jgi:putative transposase